MFQVILVYPGKKSVTLDELGKQYQSRTARLENTHECKEQVQTIVTNTPSGEDQMGANNDEKTVGEQDLKPRDEGSEPPAKRVCGAICVDKCQLTKVLFIDSTWSQARRIYLDERLKGILHLVLYIIIWMLTRLQQNTIAIYHE